MGKPRNRRRHFKRRPINVLASALTTCNLYCGIASVFYSISALLADMHAYAKMPRLLDSATDMRKFSATLIFVALVFDMLDGTVAKITHSTSEFGKQLDSLCDLVSFGVAPGVLIYTAFLQHAQTENAVTAPIGSVVAIVFVMCGALRLARYNVYQAHTRDYFTGLPIPAAGVTIASFTLFRIYFELSEAALWVLGPMTVALSYLMVSTLRYPKDKMKALIMRPGIAVQILALCVLAIAVYDYASARSTSIVLFPACLIYVLIGVGDFIYATIRRRPLHEPQPVPDEEPHPQPPQ